MIMKNFKKMVIPLLLFVIIAAGCKKSETYNQDVKTDEFSDLKSYGENKLTKSDFSSINWKNFSSQILNNQGTVYTFSSLSDKNVSFIFLKTKEKISGEVVKIKLSSGKFYTDLYDIENGSTFKKVDNFVVKTHSTENTNIAGNFTPGTTTTGGINLPPVVIVCYLNNNNIVRFNLYVSTGGGGGSGFNYVAETGSIANDVPVLDPPDGVAEPVMQFTDASEAEAFFNWEAGLSAEELAVLARFPYAALPIFIATNRALAKAQEWAAAHPGAINAVTDGRADALRHSYWNALMTNKLGATIALLFSSAHEAGSVKPAIMPQKLWDLERQMDLHNNSIGINWFSNSVYGSTSSAETIWNGLLAETGLAPLNTLQYICDASGSGNEVLKNFNQSCP
jgi:hypothetical protein